MKFATFASAVVAALSTIAPLTAAPVLVPDGDFSEDDFGFWEEGGDPNTTFSYPSSGGNPGSYGIMENNGTGFGVFVADSGSIPLEDLGLESGLQYEFFLDMILIQGDTIGGLKIEFFRENQENAFFTTGDLFIPAIGDGRSWATYTYDVTIPENTDLIRVVPLWGSDSTVGYDNVGVDNEGIVPVTIPPFPNDNFETPGGESWVFFEDLSDGDPHTVTYPASGGNPGGHALIDASAGGGFAGLNANGNSAVFYDNFDAPPLSTIRFLMDMKVFSGDNLGQMKVEWTFEGGGTGSSIDTPGIPVNAEADPAEWETYQFDFAIPDGVEQLKVVPLWGAASIVGLDNVIYDGVVDTMVATGPIPNPGFETPNGTSWTFFQGGSAGDPHTITYLPTDGNPGGHAIIDASEGSGFAGIVSNGGGFIPLERFDIEPDTDVIFSMDMKLISGQSIGQLKIEFLFDDGGLGDSGDLFSVEEEFSPDWATYTFEVYIPDGVTDIKVTPLWGPDSVVGYDNVRVGAPTPPSGPLTLSITKGTAVSWVPTSNNIFQPQESADGTTWVDLGPAFTGSTTTTTFDPTPAPFYRVEESGSTTTLDATSVPGVQLIYPAISGRSYQLQTSSNLQNFTDAGTPSTATSTSQTIIEPISGDTQFFRITESE